MNSRRKHPTRMTTALLARIKHFVVVDAVGISAVRGQHKGTRRAVIKYLKRIDLSHIPRRSASFTKWLDAQTECLRQRLPGAKYSNLKLWGVARKVLNLFLRGCLYNHYLHGKYRLDRIQTLLEIPLDSVVANKLKDKAARADKASLPRRWPGLKHLTHADSDQYQKYAAELAKKMNLPAIVFLDNYLWLANRGGRK